MDEYIERKKLNDYLDTPFTMSMGFLSTDVCKGANKAREIFKHIFDEIPAADVVPARHGRWVFNDELDDMFHCTVCDNVALRNTFNYCPNCGARMDGDRDV